MPNEQILTKAKSFFIVPKKFETRGEHGWGLREWGGGSRGCGVSVRDGAGK